MLKRLNTAHLGIHHSRHTLFISRKVHYLRKSKSFVKFIIQIHPFLKKLKLEIFSFESLLKLLKFMTFFLNANLSLEL